MFSQLAVIKKSKL